MSRTNNPDTPSGFPARVVFCQNSSFSASKGRNQSIPYQIIDSSILSVKAETRLHTLLLRLSQLSSNPKYAKDPIACQKKKRPEYLRIFVGQRLQTKPGAENNTLEEIVQKLDVKDKCAKSRVKGAITIYWVEDIMKYQDNMDTTEYLCDPRRKSEVDRMERAAKQEAAREKSSRQKASHAANMTAWHSGSITNNTKGKALAETRQFYYSKDKRYNDGGRSVCWGNHSEYLSVRPDGTYLFHSHEYSDGGNHTRHQHSWHGGSWRFVSDKKMLWLRHEKEFSTSKGMGDVEATQEWSTASISPVIPSQFVSSTIDKVSKLAWLPHNTICLDGVVDFWGKALSSDSIAYGTGTMRARIRY